MKFRSLFIGTLLASLYGLLSLFWGNGQVVQLPAKESERSVDARSEGNRFDLLVTLNGMKPDEGQMVIQLYDNREALEQLGEPVDQCFLKLSLSDEIVWQFQDLQPKKYAVVAYHDVNENFRLDLSSEGKPVETIIYSESLADRKTGPQVADPDSVVDSSGHNVAFADCSFYLGKNQVIRLDWPAQSSTR